MCLFSIFSSPFPHLYIILCSGNQSIIKLCISPPNEKVFSQGPNLRLSPGWTQGRGPPCLYLGSGPNPGPTPTPSLVSSPHLTTPILPPLPCLRNLRGETVLYGAYSAFYREKPILCSTTALQGEHDLPFPTDVETEAQKGGSLLTSQASQL